MNSNQLTMFQDCNSLQCMKMGGWTYKPKAIWPFNFINVGKGIGVDKKHIIYHDNENMHQMYLSP